MQKKEKTLIGLGAVGAVAYYLYSSGLLSSPESSGSFGGTGGAGVSEDLGEVAGETDNGTPYNITFPSTDTSDIIRFIEAGNTSDSKKETTLTETPTGSLNNPSVEKTVDNSPLASIAGSITGGYTALGSALTIEPETLKAGSTKKAISSSNLTPESKSDLMQYVGTPGNVINEQFKKISEATGTSGISQKGNEISEYTASEKANSQNDTTFLQKVYGSIISPFYEQPKSITAASNLIMPVASAASDNIVSSKGAWSGGDVSSVKKVAVTPASDYGASSLGNLGAQAASVMPLPVSSGSSSKKSTTSTGSSSGLSNYASKTGKKIIKVK
jgi:ribosomal protein L30E